MKKILSALLCAAMMSSLLLLPACSDDSGSHDHDHESEVTPGIVEQQTDTTPDTVDLPNEAVPLGGVCDGNHSFSVITEHVDNDCVYGGCERALHTCSVCGFQYHTAIRPDGAYAHGDHTYRLVETASACSGNPAKAQVCSSCGYISLVSSGGHSWSSWTATGGSSCEGGQSRECKFCHQTETRGATGHSWRETNTTPATCTQAATVTRVCNVCGKTETVTTAPALGHNYTYKSDASQHWQVCVRCNDTKGYAAHTAGSNGKCTACGYQVSTPSTAPTTPAKPDPATCDHTFGAWEATNAGAIKQHFKKCTKCGYQIKENCRDVSSPSTNCTWNWACGKCGQVIETGSKSHLMGILNITSTTHQRYCTRNGCQYKEAPAAHTFSNGKCTVCGYVNPNSVSQTPTQGQAPTASKPHTHTYGAWTATAAGHVRYCTDSTCSASETQAHTGGTPDCTGSAACSVCGAAYNTGRTGSTHTGGTEIRGAKAAEVGKAGYTGDTYCLGCGKKISSGTAIAALTASHTHSYGSSWSIDGTQHWHECSCGDKKDAAAHSFKDGKCTVCGYADPNYVSATNHVHVAGEWQNSAEEHWQVCTVDGCEEVLNKGVHTAFDGKCTVCGMTIQEIEEAKEHEADAPKPSAPAQPAAPAVQEFKDVAQTAYYYESTNWAVESGIVNGTGDGNFSPEDKCTEIQILTMLFRAERAAEDPGAAGQISGADMELAVAWAREKGFIDDSFDPNAKCTRSTAVTYMWLAAGGPSVSGASFSDVSSDAAYAQAVAWAADKKITLGNGDGTFAPDDICSRGQIATFLYRDYAGEN